MAPALIETSPSRQHTPEPLTALEPEPLLSLQSESFTTFKPEPLGTLNLEPLTTFKPEPLTALKSEPFTTLKSEPLATSKPEPLTTLKPVLAYKPGVSATENHEDFYPYEHLRPNFPNFQWDPIPKLPYSDKGLEGTSDFRHLLSAASDVFDYNPKLGTEIHGIQLSQLTAEQKNDLARLVSVRGVVFFRNQTDLDINKQRELLQYFGTLHKHATTSVPREPGLEDVHVVYTDEGSTDQRAVFAPTFLWHSDVTYEVQPLSYTALKVLTGPPRGGGGDTLWSSQYAVYDVLSPPMQNYLESLSAVHSADIQAEGSRALGRPVRREPVTTVHPLIRTHPVTGWKSVFFNPGFVTKIVGVPKVESDAIINLLNEVIATTQEAHVRFQWNKHDVAFWDNRIVNHTASYGFAPHRRHAVRVGCQGERPVFDPQGRSQEEELNALYGLPPVNKDGAQLVSILKNVYMADTAPSSILAFARKHGLATDYSLYPPQQHHRSNLPSASTSWHEILADDSSLQTINIPNLEAKLNEKIRVGSRETLALLAATSPQAFQGAIVTPDEDLRPTKRLRIASPVLRSDHELDLWEFTRPFGEERLDSCVPAIPVDEEKGQGLQWPLYYRNYGAELTRSVREEKILAGREVLPILREVMKPDLETKWLDLVNPERPQLSILEPLTPHLMPLSNPPSPYIPSSSPARVNLVSDPLSLTATDLELVDKRIHSQDRILSFDDTVGPLNSIEQSAETMLRNLERSQDDSDQERDAIDRTVDSLLLESRVRPDQLKMESLLLPEVSSPRVTQGIFPDTIEEIARGLPTLSIPDDGLDKEGDSFLQETLRVIAGEAVKRVENEQLNAIDSIQRLDVPKLEFNLPTLPWAGTSPAAMRKMTQEIQDECLSKENKFWPGELQLTQQLRWRPLPTGIEKFTIDESVKESGALSAQMREIESSMLDTCQLVWKRDRLRLLDEDEKEDDSLDLAAFDAEPDLDVVLKHRKQTMETKSSFPARAKNDIEGTTQEPHLNGNGQEENGHLLEEPAPEVSKADRLNAFVIVRTGFIPKSSGSKVRESAAQPKSAPAMKPSIVWSGELVLSPTAEPKASELPALEVPSSYVHFIISSTLLTTLSLARRIRTLFPSAQLLERDFHGFSIDDPMATAVEADMILSPSTGLLWGSLSSLAQKPLPGREREGNKVHKRIMAAARRYEKLVVLICEGRASSSTRPLPTSAEINKVHEEPRVPWGNLSPHDAMNLVEVMGIAAGLRDDVEILYVPGGEAELANWIVRMMARFGVAGESVELLEDVTEWELFLRRVGMNAYAAQVVLATLKRPAESDNKRIYGLKAFVLMSRNERIYLFERLLGGRKVLELVSSVLDVRRW
ncbi:MAG: hypothetical protein M1814_006099 [Vezdaea aestivalis]|nr:MAG: hypothetical protein M1814_006099 [Vezdaea aestivalis]